MDAYNDTEVDEIVVMASAQVGKTEIINNMVGYIIDQNPAPILVLQPTLEMAHTWSKDRLAPMLRDTPALQHAVKDPRSRDSGNTVLHKSFAGGHITMAGANSPASLASRPIRDVFCDEVDRYPVSAGSEGDPVNLAKKRTTTFHHSKIILTSTPTIKGASRIEAAYEESFKGKYHVPCPHCGELQVLKWPNVQWEADKLAYYVCEVNGCVIEEKSKRKMVLAGEWKFEGEFKGKVGFHINELYSDWRKWQQIVDDFLSAKKSPETLKTWVNTSLGETWEDEGEVVDGEMVYNRREEYELPVEVNILTAGIDVQDDRLELEVIGWGKGKENWGIEYHIINGDPAHKQVWEDLTALLRKDYFDDDGTPRNIHCACIDSGGHHTQVVYDYCAARPIQRLYAIKGMGGEGRPIAVPRDIIGYPHRKKVIPVGVDTAKSALMSMLAQIEVGEGYAHFPMSYDLEYFKQLTAEKCVTKFIKGFPHRVWVKTRVRNEAMDIRNYNMAALILSNSNVDVRIQKSSGSSKTRLQKQTQGERKNSFVNSRRKSGSWVNRR